MKQEFDIKRSFAEIYAATPAGVAVAHGRVNLIGEHVDYNGGMVLPMAISQKASVAVGAGSGSSDEVYSGYFEDRVERAFDAKANGHWSDYVVGAVQKARSLGLIDGSVQALVISDVPAGAGLSSSAAVIVATLKAILEMTGAPIDNIEVSRWAQQVENQYIGMPCGIMDQMAVAIASGQRALAINTSSLDYDLIDPPKEYKFAVMHSGVTRKLEDGRYAARRYESEEAGKLLGTTEICLIDPEKAEKIDHLPDPLNKRARHVYGEHHRVLQAIDAMKTGNINRFGALMNESHRSMRDDFEMSTPQIDELVDGAIDLGAIGARLTGGGFGGCIVACVAASDLASWRDKIAERFPQSSSVA